MAINASREHDWSRGILYVDDAEEPNGIMVFSLETGEWLRTIRTPRGDGPFEFSQGRQAFALAPDDHLFVSGMNRVITLDPNDSPISSWTPQAPMRRAVCDLDGKPTVPIPNGILRHETEVIGPEAALGHTIATTSIERGRALGITMALSRIACTEDRAFVVLSYEEGPDSVFAYRLNGEAERIAVPTDFTEDWGCQIAGRPCPPWSKNVQPSIDDRGNLALLGADWRTAGTVIDPDSGCYAMIQKNPATDMARIPVRVHGDSILVFQQDMEQGSGGFQVYMGSTNKVSIHPLRRISGEPCPGMLPSVK